MVGWSDTCEIVFILCILCEAIFKYFSHNCTICPTNYSFWIERGLICSLYVFWSFFMFSFTTKNYNKSLFHCMETSKRILPVQLASNYLFNSYLQNYLDRNLHQHRRRQTTMLIFQKGSNLFSTNKFSPHAD